MELPLQRRVQIVKMHTKDSKNIDDFWVVGLNYKKTDAAVRGLYAVNNERHTQLLSNAAAQGLTNLFLLSTCNRTEIYGFAHSAGQLRSLICGVTAGDEDTFDSISYSKSGITAIEHLFEVGAGLDSQILGDYEILGQIKCAVKQAKAHGFIGAFMERLINSVLQASKAVKTHTALSGGTVSVSFAAVQYIKQYVKDVKRKKIVLLGTGKIGRSTCRNLVDYLGAKNITLINRTEETAVALATELGLRSAAYQHLSAELEDADILLVSTNAPEPVITEAHLLHSGNKVIIDLSVPCNVSPAARTLPGITFADVDMLSKIKDETLQNRKAEVPKALAIIAEHVTAFMEWNELRRHAPVLREVKNKLKGIPVDPALFKAPADDEKIQKVINSLATKMRHNNARGCHYIEAINDYIA